MRTPNSLEAIAVNSAGVGWLGKAKNRGRRPSYAACWTGQKGLAQALDVVNQSAILASGALVDPDASLTAALKTLGIKSAEMKNKELAELEQAVRDIERAVEDGTTDVATLEAAQQAYADALAGSSGATQKTDEWKQAMQQVSTAITDFGSDLAELILKGGSFKEIMTGLFESVAKVMKTAACRRTGHGETFEGIYQVDRHDTGTKQVKRCLAKLFYQLRGRRSRRSERPWCPDAHRPSGRHS